MGSFKLIHSVKVKLLLQNKIFKLHPKIKTPWGMNPKINENMHKYIDNMYAEFQDKI